MATDFSIYQVKDEMDVELVPWVEGFYDSPIIFEERRPLWPFYDIRDTLVKKNKFGDDYVEILPEDYHLLKKYVDLSKYEKKGYKFICCII